MTPLTASSSFRPCSVICGIWAIRSAMKARCGSKRRLRCPPIWPGTTEPLRRYRCDHFTTDETETPNRDATERQLSPDATAPTTRSRKSFERGATIDADLLSARILNHIRFQK